MRLSEQELKSRYYPSWNDEKHNILSVMYGDEPLIKYNKDEHERFEKLTGTMANLEAIAEYIYRNYGDYDNYRTLIGNIKIKSDGTVLCGDISVTYRGKDVDIILNQMYGRNGLTILSLRTEKVKGFSNKDGQGSPSNRLRTEEMKQEDIEKILNMKLEDYGESVQKFMECCRNVYNNDKENMIMKQTFELRN